MKSHSASFYSKLYIIIMTLFFVVSPVKSMQHEHSNKPLMEDLLHSQKRVLILNSYHESYYWTEQVMNGINSVYKNNTDVELFIEYMDTKRTVGDDYYELLKNIYLHKYENKEFDVIITADDNALNFLLSNREELFPKVPIVFCGVNYFKPERIEGHYSITGVTEDYDTDGTLELISNLHYNSDKIVVISDDSFTGKAFCEMIQESEAKFSNRFEFEYFTNMSPDEMCPKIDQMSESTVLLWSIYLRTPEGISLTCKKSIDMISRCNDLPVYGIWDVVGLGVIGGRITSGEFQGQNAAKLANRILNGEVALDIPIVRSSQIYKFDYQELKKFGIKTVNLPVGSVVVNKPFEGYRINVTYIYLFALLLLTLLSINLILATNIKRRKIAEKNLTYYKHIVYSTNEMMALIDKDLRFIATNRSFYNAFKLKKNDLKNRKVVEFPIFRKFGEIILENSKECLNGKSTNLQEWIVLGENDRCYCEIYFYPYYEKDNKIGGFVVNARDITEKIIIQKKQMESEQKFESLYLNAPLPYQSLDFDGKLIDVNPAWLKTLGYKRSEVVGKKYIDFLHKDNASKFEQRFKLFKEVGRVHDALFKILHRDGYYLDISLEGKATYDDENNFILSYCVFKDITAQKLAENNLQISENRFKILVESSLNGIYVINDQRKFTFVNRALCDILGYSEEEILGSDFKSFVSEESIDSVNERYKRRLNGEKVESRYEFSVKCNNGINRFVEVSLARILDNDGRYQIIAHLVDMSKRKENEQELIKRAKQLSRAQAIGKMGNWKVDLNTGIMTGSRETAKLYGLDGLTEIRSDEIQKIHLPEYRDMLDASIQNLIEKNEKYDLEFRIKNCKTDKIIDVHSIAEYDAKENEVSGIIQDITERKLIEEKLRKNVEEKDTLLRELYHRTKNNMQVIISLLALKTRTLDNPQTKQLLKEITNKIKSMALVHQKLYQSQDLSEINLASYISDLVTKLLRSYSYDNKKIALELDMEQIKIMIDSAVPLGLIINELITNCMKYAYPIGHDAKLFISLKNLPESLIELVIQDNGVGIPEGFEPDDKVSMGMRIVNLLGSQIKADILRENDNGVKWTIRFKDDLHMKRI